MSKRKYDKPIAGHEYDGIKELNNPLPRWWLATFFGTIVFAMFYFGYYVLGNGPSQDETLEVAMAKIEGRYQEAKEEHQENAPAPEEIDVDDVMNDADAMARGKKQFETICMPCHGMHGEGTIGPNLTDKYWIHIDGGVEGILESLRKGYPDKGMPPWEKIVPPEDQVPLAVYVKSLQGTNPPNPKEPQGELVDGSGASGDEPGKAMESGETPDVEEHDDGGHSE
jgi:cytochrome c oxidase cbb3-type subunit 3